MKTKEITIKGLQFENGNIIIGISNGNYFVKTSDGIFTYNLEEMIEIYDFNDNE